jgi:hypothetical protein
VHERRSHRQLAAEASCQPGQEGVRRPWAVRTRRPFSRCARDVCRRGAGSRQAAGGQRGADRVQISRAGLCAIKTAQLSCGVKEQLRRVAVSVHGEREPGAHEASARLPVIVQSVGLRQIEQLGRGPGFARLQHDRSGGEAPFCPPRRIRCHAGGALEERGRGGEAAARLRPACRALQFGGDVLVQFGQRRGPVPCAAIRISAWIGSLR